MFTPGTILTINQAAAIHELWDALETASPGEAGDIVSDVEYEHADAAIHDNVSGVVSEILRYDRTDLRRDLLDAVRDYLFGGAMYEWPSEALDDLETALREALEHAGWIVRGGVWVDGSEAGDDPARPIPCRQRGWRDSRKGGDE